MKINTHWTGSNGVEYDVEYTDVDTFDELDYSRCKQVYGVCFCDGKMLLGFGGKKKGWGLIGGTIEVGETFEETLKREIQEESNTEVISAKPIGYQKCTDTRDGSYVYQLRFVCEVRPYGPFVSDPCPDGITEIKYIDPSDYKQYFDWGEVGERIIGRAMEIRDRY